MNKKTLLVILVFVTGLIFRLWVADKGWHVDLWSNAAWGEWVHTYGPAKFYENSVWVYSWPTQPPLTNLVYSWNKDLYIQLLGRLAWINHQVNKVHQINWLTHFVWWFGYGRINTEIPFQIGYLVTMKLLPILADLIISAVIYFIGKKKILWPAIYLFSPFSWYLSAGWGQYDGVGLGLALVSFLSIFGNLSILGPGLLTLAILIKPTSLILLPFFGYVYLRKKKNVLGLILPILIFWVTSQPFTHKNPLEFARYDLTRIVFAKSEPRISVNAFNFWRIFIGNAAKRDNIPSLSLMFFGVINVLGIYHFEKQKLAMQALWESLFIVAMGSFLFMTGMLERYAFAGVVFGLVVVINRPKLFKYWLGMSVIFWLNLYYHWWWPERLGLLKATLSWNQDVITRMFSAVQVILFAKLMSGSFRKSLPHPTRKLKKPV